jgi:DNA topoisomerase I
MLRKQSVYRPGLKNYRLVPYTVMAHPKSGRAPYFATRWKKVAYGKSDDALHIAPIENYRGSLETLYEVWRRYVREQDSDISESLLAPISALQEAIHRDMPGIFAIEGNRVVGIAILDVDINQEANISISSASPYDMVQGNEEDIEDALSEGISQYVDGKGWTLVSLEKAWGNGQIDALMCFLQKQMPPGPPPRPGLAWKPQTHRWIRPNAPKGQKEEWRGQESDEDVWTPSKVRIPPNWRDVWINTNKNAPLQALGIDSKGRKQYLYSAAHTEKKAAQKFKKVKSLVKDYPKIMQNIQKGRQDSKDPSIKDSADALFLVAQTGMRPGSEKETGGDVKAYGATTLLGKHVKTRGRNAVELNFVGKKGVHIQLRIENPDLVKMLKERKGAAGDNGKLFPHTTDTISRHYLRSVSGGKPYNTKDLRTLHATSSALAEIEKMPPPQNKAQYQKSRMAIGKLVSQQLGNTPNMALTQYIDPHVFSSWRGELEKQGVTGLK